MSSRLKVLSALFIPLALAGCNFPGLAPAGTPPTAQTAATTPAAPTDPGQVAAVETNLALGAPVTATAFLPGFEPEKAVDGIDALDVDNWWSAGAGPPQNIQIDLGIPADVVRIRLVASQSPAGETLHLVLGRRPGDSQNITLGQLAGETADGHEFILTAGGPWHGIRYIIVQTIQSPSWVAWREIEVFGLPSEPFAAVEPTATASQAEPSEPADLIFTNADILTMDFNQPQAEAIAIRGDRVLAVGPTDEVLSHRGSATQVIDLGGRTIAPGFIDSHSHRIGDRWLYGYGDERPEAVIREAIAGGWTGLHELFVSPDRLDELAGLAEGGALPIRVSMYLTMNYHHDRDDWWTAYTPLQSYGPYLQIAGLKITLDQEWGETVFFNQAQLTDMITFAADRGWQVAVHAFTPETDLMTLNAYETAIVAHPDEDFRFRLEHIGVITDEGIQKMAYLEVLGSIQFVNTTGFILDESFRRVFPEEMWPLVARWRDLIEAGVLLIGNTDAPWCCTPWRNPDMPVSTAPVMEALHHAVTRSTNFGLEPEPWQLAQAITVAEALEMLTIRGAYAAHQEDDLGSLTPGKYADLVILSANPLDVPVEAIPGIEVLLTMIGGEVAFCPPGQGEICP
ncbi:MAG TPA: amidohydrolase family protein [Anaerolineales bacterium]|nr:amidohydrolase family protein [Anaerolineales bacterium]